MFKKIGISLILVGVIAISGCSFITGDIPTPTPISTETVPESTPDIVIPVDNIYDLGEPTGAPMDAFWVSPGKFDIQPYYAGATIKCLIRVHNGKSVVTPFSIISSIPDNTDSGFVPSNAKSSSWITISDPNPALAPFETREIIVTLAMPEGATAPGQKWEFWVCSKDEDQVVLVQTRLCTKFQVTME